MVKPQEEVLELMPKMVHHQAEVREPTVERFRAQAQPLSRVGRSEGEGASSHSSNPSSQATVPVSRTSTPRQCGPSTQPQASSKEEKNEIFLKISSRNNLTDFVSETQDFKSDKSLAILNEHPIPGVKTTLY